MNKKIFKPAIILTALGLPLASCGSGTSGHSTSSGGLIRVEQYCKMGSFEPSLRQTFILIDAKVLKQAKQATEFAQSNGFIRDLILSFADPKQALASGLSAPRERISVLLVPSDGSPAQPIFSGCIPGLSQDEEAAARQNSSSMGEFFTGDPLEQLNEDAKQFQLGLIGALTEAAKKGAREIEPQLGPIAATSLFSAIKASRGVLEVPKGMIPRFVIVSDLSAATFENTDSKDTPYKQGQDAGFKAGGDFGLSEVSVIQPKGTFVKGKEYLEGFLLAQGGQLTSISVGRPIAAGRAPTQVFFFEGSAAYPSRTQNIKLRIAGDSKGTLTSSWLTILGGENQPIPMSGQITCTSSKMCTVLSDDKGFSQAWADRRTADPQFSNDLPFGGMRNFRLTIEGSILKGDVSDPMVQLGDDPSKNSIAVKAIVR